jgi:hypothetical protein
MRRLILITAMLVASATAQAGQSRSLTMVAAADEPAVAAPVKPADEAKPTEAPTYVARPAAIDTAPSAQPCAEPAKPAVTAKAERPKPRRHWSEARIIGELHRHGIYW